MMAYLKQRATDLKSNALSALLLRMKEDHFVKVRTMIKDMMAKLEADAASESDQKQWCDDEMSKTMAKRDENTGLVESDTAAVAEATAAIARKNEEIQMLLKEISESRNGLNEATELRSGEKAQNTKAVLDAEMGLAGVTRAIGLLKDFYDNALVQTR